VLLLASAFERRGTVLPDSGFRGRVSEGEWRTVEEAMTARLRAGAEADGLIAGLEALELLLMRKGFSPGGAYPNELPDRPIVGPGAP
jgi:uncharacterized membrane protein